MEGTTVCLKYSSEEMAELGVWVGNWASPKRAEGCRITNLGVLLRAEDRLSGDPQVLTQDGGRRVLRTWRSDEELEVWR
jgi:hypothetical protein